MVVDSFNEGIPVAFCLASHDSFKENLVFFRALKDRIGEIIPSCLMSDDAAQFYNAFSATFSSQPPKILCAWHVWRVWKRKANSITVSDKRELSLAAAKEKAIPHLKAAIQEMISCINAHEEEVYCVPMIEKTKRMTKQIRY